MKVRTLIKILLLITASLCVFSVAVQNFNLKLYIKPMTVPLFFMMYWFNIKKIDSLFLVVLFFCFLTDIFLLVQIEHSFILVLLSNIVRYLILFVYVYRNKKKIDFSKTERLSFLIFLVFWSCVVYVIYSLIEVSMREIRPYGILYICILYVLLAAAIFQYINTRSLKLLWFLIACINFVVSDTCFVLDQFYISSLELKVVSLIYQLLAIYFLVKFQISSADYLKIKSD